MFLARSSLGNVTIKQTMKMLCWAICRRMHSGSIVQRFMGLPRMRKGHGSSSSRGAC